MGVSFEPKTRHLYAFGPFRLDPERELLLHQGETVSIPPKAFQVLLVLLHHSNHVVTKDDLLKSIWPDTFVEEANLSRNIFLLRKALGETPQDHRYIVTVPGRGYRFAEDVRLVPGHEEDLTPVPDPDTDTLPPPNREPIKLHDRKSPRAWLAGGALALAAAGVIAWRNSHPSSPVLTEKDTVVLADVTNTTGDPVFDGALRQGLAVQLEQSPYLSLVSDARIQQTLRLMDKPAGTPVTPAVALEICQRTGSAAVLNGTIAQIGTRYLLTLKAARCSDGESLAGSEADAGDKNGVLDALGKIASDTRNKLGESLSTSRQFNTPLEQATTSSLEALQAYSFGRRAMSANGDWPAAVPFFQRAVDLDPNFAIAYARLGMAYRNLGEDALGAENAERAYKLRERASESERFYIDSHYYLIALADLVKARRTLELWARTYPRDYTPWADLNDISSRQGLFDQALTEARHGAGLDSNGVLYSEIVSSEVSLNHLQQARDIAEEAQARRFDSPYLHVALYRLAFLQHDASGMAKEAAWAAGRSGIEDRLLNLEANSEAFHGHLRLARTFADRAVESAKRGGEAETAAAYEAHAAMRGALLDMRPETRSRAEKALRLSPGRIATYRAAMALAGIGDTAKARALADDLAARFPTDTLVNYSFLPTIRGRLALSESNPSEALKQIGTVLRYEPNLPPDATTVDVQYLRGMAYVSLHDDAHAAAEFSEIVAHPEIAFNNPTAALAHLQLARCYAHSGEKDKAQAAYRDFLDLWKDADAGIPLLQQATSEFARLR